MKTSVYIFGGYKYLPAGKGGSLRPVLSIYRVAKFWRRYWRSQLRALDTGGNRVIK